MAERDLIGDYLAELRRELGRRREVGDVLAEVEDHLREVAAWHVQRGMDPVSADRHALGQFGTSALVARAFIQQGKGIAMPTSFTRRSGFAWLLAALLLAPGLVLVLHEAWRGAWDATTYAYGGMLSGAGAALLLVAMLGMWRRHGGALGLAGRAGVALVGVAILPTFLLTWFTPIWMTLLALGCALFAVALARSGATSRTANTLFGGGAVLVTGAMWAGGPLEAFSDRFVWGLPGLIGGLAFVAGCAWLGYVLWMEAPVDTQAGLATS